MPPPPGGFAPPPIRECRGRNTISAMESGVFWGYVGLIGGLVRRIREVSAGTIHTIAGTGSGGFSGDNGTATAAKLDNPTALAIDGQGNLYIADTGNQRIRKLAGTTITTVAGNGFEGFAGGRINWGERVWGGGQGGRAAEREHHRCREGLQAFAKCSVHGWWNGGHRVWLTPKYGRPGAQG